MMKYNELQNYVRSVPTYYAAVHIAITQNLLILNVNWKSTFALPS